MKNGERFVLAIFRIQKDKDARSTFSPADFHTMKLTYFSHSCFLVETDSHRFIIDPYLSGNPLAEKAEIKPENVVCDYVFVTHGHFDHLGDAVQIARKNNATVIAMYEVADFLAHSEKIKTHGMGVGGAHVFSDEKGSFEAKMTIAFHSAGYDVSNGELSDGRFVYLGNPAGFLIKADGDTIYHAGDTALTLEMKLLGKLNKIDVALLPIGDNFTMGPKDAAMAAKFLKCDLAIPMHYNTFGLIEQNPEKFVKKCEKRGVYARALDIGQSVEF